MWSDEMNTNDIISIISKSITTAFPGIETSKESIKQDFNTPAFYIAQINDTHKKIVGNKYRKKFSMSIKYYPDEKNTDNVKQELHSISDTLTNVLEIMSYENKTIKGYNMESRIEDDVLHFLFDVDNRIIKKTANTKFGPLEVDVNVR